jgi:hypothetical protein
MTNLQICINLKIQVYTIQLMPIYMDIHEVPGAEAPDLAGAHRKDLLIQDEYRSVVEEMHK